MVGPRLPKSNKPTPQGRRLEAGQQKRSRWANHNPNSAKEEAQRSAELEKARDALGSLLESFIKLLTSKTLAKNRTRKERDYQKDLMSRIPLSAAELDVRNVKEGSMSIFTTAMNSLLVLRDEINNLRFQNYFLNKKVDERFSDLEEKIKSLEEKSGSNDE
jgi:hypothetical protein